MTLSRIELSVLGIESQTIEPKSAKVRSGRLVSIVPTNETRPRIAADQFRGIVHLVFSTPPLDQQTVFGLGADKDRCHAYLNTTNVPLFANPVGKL